ncbi:UPF0481 protein At3g47200-like isoform X1 [Coffea eugenioides]|uniref:UPF0481 protein At3g47200-like isoform X1 n=1 Tax=Coffea eugenioides TaxID=49369 RepID=UPI000F612F2A|nr:UPF0481 protein At3g47200-like isoform X1 [Coffea eugenioides]
MQKVPPLLRLDKNNQQDYDPLVVSLGPYHHGKEELQSAEDFKLIALEMFVADSGHDVLFFYFKVLQLVNDARNCYFEDSTKKYDDETFAQMMLLDACFIINDIISRCKSGANFYITRYCLGDLASEIVLRDMFLLENQIPFWLLKFLMCLRCGKQEGEEMLNEFLNGTMFGNYKGSGIASRDKDLPHHLLDAFWLVLVSESCKDKPTSPKSRASNDSVCLNHFKNFGRCSNLHEYICNLPCFLWWRRSNIDNDSNTKKYVHCFRSATELKAKGIHFRRSSADSLKGIKFKSGYFYATLEVPIWFVSIYTKVFFLNMIAYEMCPSTSTDRAVTAYIEFMKSLIDSPKDVKELREKRILLTTLGSDEEVLKVYKDINTYGVRNVTIFHGVKEKIQAHYNNKAKTWLAELFYTYFNSPWTAIALFAAAFLLVLTFLQTYYTVRPS